MTFRLFLAAIAAWIGAPAHAQVLWQNVEAGMTVEQIQTLYPAARLHPSLEERAQLRQRHPSLAATWANNDNYLLDNAPAPGLRMQFKFGTDQRLLWVALIGNGRDTWSTVVAGLRERYGPEATRQPIASDGSETLTWQTPAGVTITATFEGQPAISRYVAISNIFNVRYEARRSLRDAL